MSTPDPALDPLTAGVGLAVVLATAAALLNPRRTTSVVAFLVLDFLLAVSYALLGAPDVALAEAAVGSGVTGVLLVLAIALLPREVAAGRAGRADGVNSDTGDSSDTKSTSGVTGAPAGLRARVTGALGVLAALGVTALLGSALAPLGRGEVAAAAGTSAGEVATASIAEAGVDHPVTAVLLNFRSFDTFLEIVVLLVSVVVVLNLAAPVGGSGAPQSGRGPATRETAAPLSGALVWFVRLVGPLLVLVAAWLLFAGSSSPGGAFQAGAVLAAVLILAAMAGYRTLDLHGRLVRWVAVAAVVAFAGVAIGTLVTSGVWLDLPEFATAVLIVALEVVLAAVIGASLAIAYLGLQEVRDDDR